MVDTKPQALNQLDRKLEEKSLRIAMANQFIAQYQKMVYNEKDTVEFPYNGFGEPVNGGPLEQVDRNTLMRPLTERNVPLDQGDWFNMTNQLIDKFRVANNFPQINGFFPQPNSVSPSNFLPIYNPMLKPLEPVSIFSPDKEETNLSQFLMQMLPGNAAVLPEGANAVDVHPVPYFLRGKVDEWEKTFREQYGNKKEPYETSMTVDFLPSSSGVHLRNRLQEKLEEHRVMNGQAAVYPSTYLGDTLDEVNFHREMGLNKWAIDNSHLAEEYWAAVDHYERNVRIKEPLSVELATECSRRRIRELTTENNRNGIFISLAYAFAISTMNPELARDINAVMSYQNEPEVFERLENYFAERYKKEMIRLN